MSFLPKAEVLSLEELDRLCGAFVRLGVRKLRLTGGEPLVRRDILWLVRRLGRHLETGDLAELTLTTNATQLGKYAAELRAAGVRRVNVSLDTLDAAKFQAITRSEAHTYELQSLMRISYAIFCLTKNTNTIYYTTTIQ